MRRIYLSLLALSTALIPSLSLKAQPSFGGVVINHDIMMPTDFAQLSMTQPFGTARSMAMGSAFTSLGADHASNSINPAGLGMFMSEEFTFTPMISNTRSHTANTQPWNDNSVTKFGFSNIGANFQLNESGSGALISLHAAFTYNRLANYNSQTSFSSSNENELNALGFGSTVADLFGSMLGTGGIYPGDNGSMKFDNNPYFWPAQLAYKTFMIDPTDNGTDYTGWTTNSIGTDAQVYSSMDISQKGRADEYVFGLGGNISNILYFGVSLGVTDIKQSTQYIYHEDYLYDFGGAPIEQLEYSHLAQEVIVSGTGCNLKLGLIARPTRGLRIGVAFHTPTATSLARSYVAAMETNMIYNDNGTPPQETFKDETDIFIDDYENSWRYSTPSKLLTGVSYQLGSLGIVSFDYERMWYNGIRVNNVPNGAEFSPRDYKETYKDNYKPVNTFRAGIELKPHPAIALRAGAGASSSMLKDESLFYSAPTATTSNYYSCGLGIQFSRSVALDVTYQRFNQHYSSYKLFYVDDPMGFYSESGNYTSNISNNYFVATLAFKL